MATFNPYIGGDKRTTEQDYLDKIDKKDGVPDLVIRDFDLKPHAPELFNSHLP